MREVAISNSEGLNSSKIIFEGLVERQELKTGVAGGIPTNALSITLIGQHREVSFRVLRTYRGRVGEDAIVLTGMGLGDCGFDFDTGKQYLVYADRMSTSDLYTSICSGTSLLEHAGPALRYLRGERPTTDDLLDVQVYQDEVEAQWYGTACGHVTQSDGSPVSEGSVDMTEIRDEPLPPKVARGSDLSKPDGSFCIESIVPGKYLLTAERFDFDDSIRWMGFYPGVGTHSAAAPIEVQAGERLSDLNFSIVKQRLYTVSFRIVTPTGSPLPLKGLSVAIDSTDQDQLAYHLRQARHKNGLYFAGFVPPGHYIVQTYVEPDFKTGKFPPELSKWGMARQEVDISSGAEILLRLESR